MYTIVNHFYKGRTVIAATKLSKDTIILKEKPILLAEDVYDALYQIYYNDLYDYINTIEDQLIHDREKAQESELAHLKKKSPNVKAKAAAAVVTDVQTVSLAPKIDPTPSPAPQNETVRNGITNAVFQAWCKQNNDRYKIAHPTMKSSELKSTMYIDWKKETKL